jgi:hypothetical protein
MMHIPHKSKMMGQKLKLTKDLPGLAPTLKKPWFNASLAGKSEEAPW